MRTIFEMVVGITVYHSFMYESRIVKFTVDSLLENDIERAARRKIESEIGVLPYSVRWFDFDGGLEP